LADPNYLKRISDIRERNILSRAGKALIFRESEMIDLISQNKVPTQMQHCIIKVMPKMSGPEKEQFISAFNICGAVFQKHGYQKPRSTILTGKGLQNNLRHRREDGGGIKTSNYKSIEQRLWAAQVFRAEKDKEKKAQENYEKFKQEKNGGVKTANQRVNDEKE
jgi:hypothetical protein